MGEGSPIEWARVVDSLVALRPAAVVAGHFGPSRPEDLSRFRDYLTALVQRTTAMVAKGFGPDSVAATVRMDDFGEFAQHPEFGATFGANARRVATEVIARRKAPAALRSNGAVPQ
jgi:hypothetical protein